MSVPVSVDLRLSPDMLADLDRVAEWLEKPRQHVLERAVAEYLREAEGFRAFLQEAEDEIDRGEYYTQEQMEEWARSLRRPAAAE